MSFTPQVFTYDHHSEVDADWFRKKWPSFTPQELSCNHCGKLVIDLAAMDKLQTLRRILNRPINVTSGTRCVQWNASVGGASSSYHLNGRAFDIPIAPGDDRSWLVFLAGMAGFTGLGVYETFIHVDTGPRRFWDENEN